MSRTLPSLLLALACSCFLFPNPSLEVVTAKGSEHEMEYGILIGAGGIQWTVDRSKELGIFIQEHSKCDLSLEEQIPYREAILKKVLGDTQENGVFHAFFWGSLKRGDATDEFSKRLTQAVSKSPLWNKRTGKLIDSRKSTNRFVVTILNQEKVFSELATVFSNQKMELKVEDAEMVLVDNVSYLENGQTKKGKLPYDCLVRFSIRRWK